jgi:prolyl oligopeptidase
MRTNRILLLLLLALALAPGRGTAQGVRYPAAARDSTVDVYFGTRVPAPYRWMEELNAPATTKWVEEENALSTSLLAAIPDRDSLKARLTTLANYARVGLPTRQAGRLFYRANSGMQAQPVLFQRSSPDSPARVVVDPNALSPDGKLALQGYSVSPKGRYVALGFSEGGSDLQSWVVSDLATGRATGDTVRNLKFSTPAWTRDERGFFYTRVATEAGKELRGANTASRVFYHSVGTAQAEDRLIYERPESPELFPQPHVSDDGRYVWLYVTPGGTENELWYIPLGDPLRPALGAAARPITRRADAEAIPIGNVGDTIFLRSTLGAPKRRIVAVALGDTVRSHWRTVVPEGKNVIEDALVTGGRVAVQTLEDVQSRLRLYDRRGTPVGDVRLPGVGTIAAIGGRADTPEIWYTFSSYLAPTTVYRYDLATKQSRAFEPPKGAFDPAAYEARQVFYPSRDGTRVPMFIVSRKGLVLDGNNPVMLYAYGGFGSSTLPAYSGTVAAWLEKGGVYAVANLRGGGEYGEAWHQAGMRDKKQNVFDDFIAAAQYLIDQRYTRPARLAVRGSSNGGLLVGAVMTQRPDLFAVALPAVGVMDMLRYQKFTGGAFWVPEYGSSDDPAAFQYLSSYSPLQNVHAGTCYPATLLTTADHDDRVVPSHTYQFAAALQAAQGCANPIVLRVDTGSHGYRPTERAIAETADILAFAWHYLQVAPATGGAR